MSNFDEFKKMGKGLDLAQAIAEADRCLLCHDAPCSEGCPADTKPGEFIRKLRFKNITGAREPSRKITSWAAPAECFARHRGCVKKNAAPCLNL